jgi:predicted nucleotidyltransferase
MRLNDREIDSIKQSAREVFGVKVKVYLFGSRVFDDKKGGDIDLYIETENTQNIYDNKIKFLVALDKRIGEQKVDVVISRDKNAPIEKSALKYGIAL